MNTGDQNAQQVGQNPLTQTQAFPVKSRINYLTIGVIILVCFIIFGFGGYFLGKQSSVSKDFVKEPQSTENDSVTTFNTQSYKVMQQPAKATNNSCVVRVEEQRSNYGGPTNPQYLPVQTESFALTLRKQDGEWKIDQYQSLDPKIKKGKYSGFLMEYAN